SYFVVAHFHYVLAGGAVFPMFAGIYHWGPKMLGRRLDERVGKLSFWLMFVGFNLTFFPMHLAGLQGQPRRTYTYASGLGWDGYNLLESVGVLVLGLGILATLVNWLWCRRFGDPAGEDPWQGETLEWTTSSPPPEYNFATIPIVRSREPAWDQPELRGGDAATGEAAEPLEAERSAPEHASLSTSLVDASPRSMVEMPHASPWPLFLALAILATCYAVLLELWLAAGVGMVAVGGAIAGWLWPRGETQET
ncbi:MAG TPA: cbb3-type cytochrome c oxidase subunit I, partial [Actinomycetota bacterium]|nr:cbb3-type cytochrome c oxidase subunit I [Actinomycetota bacterium]